MMSAIYVLTGASWVIFLAAGYVISNILRKPSPALPAPASVPQLDTSAFEGQIATERRGREAAEGELKRVRDALGKAKADEENLTRQLQSQGFAAQKFLQERSAYQEQIEQQRNEIQKHTSQVAQLHQELQQLRSTKSGPAAGAQSELDLERKLRKTAERERADLTQKLESISQQLNESRVQLKVEKDARTRYEEERSALAAQLPKLKAENADLQKRLKRPATAPVVAATAAAATAAAATAAATASSLRPELDRVKKDNVRLNQQLEKLVLEHEEIKVRFETSQSHAQRARKEADRLNLELENLQQEMSSAAITTKEFEAPESGQAKEFKASDRKTTQAGVAVPRLRHPAPERGETTDTHDDKREILIRLQKADAQAAELEKLSSQYKRAENDLREMSINLKTAEAQLVDLQKIREEHRVLREEHKISADATAALAAAQNELRGLRIKLQTTEARAAEVEKLREEHRELREEHHRAGDASAELATAQNELRDLRIKLQTTEARAAEVERLREENLHLREEQSRFDDASKQLGGAETELRDLRIKLQTAEARAADVERLREENHQIREELDNLRHHGEAAGQLENLEGEHRQLLVKADVLARRIKELETGQAERVELQARVDDLAQRAADAEELRERAKVLEAQLLAAGHAPRDEDRDRVAPSVDDDMSTSEGIEAGLAPLLQTGETSVAVLADSHGLLVASTGDPTRHEGLAALSGLAGSIAYQARGLLPLGRIAGIRVTDVNNLVVNFRLFISGTDELALATLGAGSPPKPDALEKAVKYIAGVVGRPLAPQPAS